MKKFVLFLAESLIAGTVVDVVVAFFLACEDFRRMFDNSFPACAIFSLFVLMWRLARAQ